MLGVVSDKFVICFVRRTKLFFIFVLNSGLESLQTLRTTIDYKKKSNEKIY